MRFILMGARSYVIQSLFEDLHSRGFDCLLLGSVETQEVDIYEQLISIQHKKHDLIIAVVTPSKLNSRSGINKRVLSVLEKDERPKIMISSIHAHGGGGQNHHEDDLALYIDNLLLAESEFKKLNKSQILRVPHFIGSTVKLTEAQSRLLPWYVCTNMFKQTSELKSPQNLIGFVDAIDVINVTMSLIKSKNRIATLKPIFEWNVDQIVKWIQNLEISRPTLSLEETTKIISERNNGRLSPSLHQMPDDTALSHESVWYGSFTPEDLSLRVLEYILRSNS